jgi:PAS domain S-box-containing protein
MPESVQTGLSGTMKKTTPDGRTWRIRFVPMRDAHGDISRIVEIREEITEAARSREKRREAERHRALILDTMQEMLAYHDTDLRVQWANRASAESVGEAVEDLVGRHCYEIWHQRARPCEGCPVLDAMRTGQPQEGETNTPNGRVYRLRAYPVCDDTGALIGAVEYGFDITDAKAAERALKASEEKFRKAFDTDIVAMAVTRRRDGMYLDANPGFQKMTGYAHDEIVGHTPLELGFYSREERAALVSEVTEKGRLNNRELTFPTKSKGWKTILFSIAPIVLDTEDCLLATMVDITERKKVEEALKKEGERLNDILQGTRAGTWEWFVSTGETRFNERWAEIVGYTLAELQPVNIRTWMDLCHPEDLKRSEALLQSLFSGDSDYYECEARMRHKGGHWVWVQDRGKVVEWTAEGKPRRMTGTHIDVTERKQLEAEHRSLEQRLQQIQKAESLARMAGAVAHHFNNMLAVILGNLEMAREELSSEERALSNIAEAYKAARRAADISRLMLTYLGQDPAPRHPLDLSAVCRSGLESRRADIQKGCRLKQDLPEPGPVITGNAAQMKQVLDVLVENAWEALAERPEGVMIVSVGAADSSDIGKIPRFPADWIASDRAYARLTVTDNSDGMDEETIGRIFDPFFTTKFTGRGLGLPAALGIVKAHGGCVTVESSPGRGSVFRVFLPLSA